MVRIYKMRSAATTERGAALVVRWSVATVEIGGDMLLLLAIILALAWITGFGVFHVAGALIHVLVVLAIISLLLHLIRGRRGS
jgi:hypothetical protein